MILMINAICSASIEINDSRSTADYWINRSVDVNKILMTREEIEEFNKNILSRDKFASDLKNYPMKLSASKVNELIKLGEYKTYSGNHNINFDVNVRYAVTVERGDIRLQPTYFNGDNYDSHQGTAIDPCEAVAVLIESPDKKFLFVQSRNYLGWIDKNKIAFTDRQTWQNYINPKQFIVVTANKKIIEVYDKKYLFQMGAKIPVVFVGKCDDNVIMKIPTLKNGQLKIIDEAMPLDDKDTSYGYLNCTKKNFIRQAFKFLGDEYGWGGLNESVDCSSFVQNIYRTMGFEIPRDADRQEGCMPIWSVFNNVTHAERFDIVSRAPIGSLLFKPGHVMMKLGNDDQGNPLVIHSASSYFDNGQKIYIRKVIVSDLHYKNYLGVETIDGLTGISFIGHE